MCSIGQVLFIERYKVSVTHLKKFLEGMATSLFKFAHQVVPLSQVLWYHYQIAGDIWKRFTIQSSLRNRNSLSVSQMATSSTLAALDH